MKRSEDHSTDLLILHEEEAEEWGRYLVQIFSEHFNQNSLHCYKITNAKELKSAAPQLASYKCKLLILTNGLLTGLTTSMRIHLGKIFQPPDNVVILRCGVVSSDKLYELICAERGYCEISSEQDPQEYLAAVTSIIKPGSLVKPDPSPLPEEMRLSDPVEAASSDSASSSVLVIPNRIQCKNPTKMFILLRDGTVGENPEVEFLGSIKKVKIQATVWNSQAICVQALDFPAGPVTVNIYCQGFIKATAHIVYYTAMEEIECLLLKAADPIEFICQAFEINSRDRLDQLFTRMLRNRLPPGGLGVFQMHGLDETNQSNYTHSEFPTLLHFAAKNGLQNLTAVLMEIPGAIQACRVLNKYGESPSSLAESHGFKKLQELIDKLALQFERSEDQRHETLQSNYDVDSVGLDEEENVYEIMTHIPNAKERKDNSSVKDIEEYDNEDIYTLALDDDPYDMILPEENSNGAMKKESSANVSKRPPAPIPRPSTLQYGNTPFIAQVFQQKTTKEADEKLYAVPRDAARGESPTYDTFGKLQSPAQQQLIHLQQQVKKGMLKLDEAEEKFKQWQREQKDQDTIQQGKLRNLRENIIKDRHEDEFLYDRIKIIHLSDEMNAKPQDVYSIPSSARPLTALHPSPAGATKMAGLYARPQPK
uniref:B-cell scaffold protein with ankyrin repeats-like protein n=1 Tax=Callorhinchus milii TaxID=7868 RepID=V9KFU4_CALMI